MAVEVVGKPFGAVRYTSRQVRYGWDGVRYAWESPGLAFVYETPMGFVYSTSPSGMGISWTEGGPHKTLDDLLKELGGGEFIGLEAFEEFGPARVRFWTKREERRFWAAFAVANGPGAMINKRARAHLVDDTPGKVGEEEENPPPQPDDEELVLDSIHGPTPRFKPGQRAERKEER